MKLYMLHINIFFTSWNNFRLCLIAEAGGKKGTSNRSELASGIGDLGMIRAESLSIKRPLLERASHFFLLMLFASFNVIKVFNKVLRLKHYQELLSINWGELQSCLGHQNV